MRKKIIGALNLKDKEGKEKKFCSVECQKRMQCQGCQLIVNGLSTIKDEKGVGIKVCSECRKKYPDEPNDIPNKEIPDKGKEPPKDQKPKPNEVCERCGISCKKLISTDKEKGTQTYQITRKRITH